ncbi:MAG TPA: ornithine carbamoyltransferase [Sandaracinaceae bacterium LLY-WYZ-13_1]|nr:ornithine carbamoyltransferase [Sandaracinaceae bacterium LLY-WYZ-13_1]
MTGGVRHFRTLLDTERDELNAILDRADVLKRARGTAAHPRPLADKSVVILLEKASTRTRVSFEVGVTELGGFSITLIAKDTQLGRGEPLEDTARMFSGYAHAVVYRTFGHDRIEALARHASIPIVNGLSEDYHPCQLLADLQTVRAHHGRLEGVRAAWIGDGNNMAHSWILAAARTGLVLRLACPEGYEPRADIVERARDLGADVAVVRDPREAAEGAGVVTTDVWASMGQEAENAARREAFDGYQVNAALMGAASPEGIFLHCLPAHRGEEVSGEVIDGPRSCVWEEAENRLHAQKALLEWLL